MTTASTATPERPRVNSAAPFAPRPRPTVPAHILRSEAEALEVAERLRVQFAQEAGLRDREGYLPLAEIDAYSQSGLWALNVPKAYGGLGASYATIAKVSALIAAGDSCIAQIAHNHLALVGHIDADGTEAQKQELFGLVLRGYRLGNAFSELHSKTVTAFETRARVDGDDVVVNGEKFYTTGALLAHIVPIVAVSEAGQGLLVFAERDAPGLTVSNNWSSFGQRTTASGGVKIEQVRVPRSRVIPIQAFENQTVAGAVSQIIQAAIDVGIARQAIDETIHFVRTQSRPWIDSGKDSAAEDVFTIQAVGDLKIKLHAAEALLERAGHSIDRAAAAPDAQSVAEATTATAEAKVLTTHIAIEATNRLFELAGTRATLVHHNLDRYWRNARVHTLHDPVRWKYFHVGNFYLNGVNPPRNAWN